MHFPVERNSTRERILSCYAVATLNCVRNLLLPGVCLPRDARCGGARPPPAPAGLLLQRRLAGSLHTAFQAPPAGRVDSVKGAAGAPATGALVGEVPPRSLSDSPSSSTVTARQNCQHSRAMEEQSMRQGGILYLSPFFECAAAPVAGAAPCLPLLLTLCAVKRLSVSHHRYR